MGLRATTTSPLTNPVSVAAPVYAGHDLTLQSSATIAATIPASLTLPARPNRVVVGNGVWLKNPSKNNGNKIGDEGDPLDRVYVGGTPNTGGCKLKNASVFHSCSWDGSDWIWATNHTSVPITKPELTCCSADAVNPTNTTPVNWGRATDGTSHTAAPSYMAVGI